MTKEESINQHEQGCGYCGLPLPTNLLMSDVVSLNSQSVRMILDELLQQEKSTLSDSARYQEVESMYHLIGNEPIFPPYMVGMSLSLARSWVLLALRKADIPLGVESEFDKLFLKLTPYLQRLGVNQYTKYHSIHQLNHSLLLPYKVFASVGKTLDTISKGILSKLLKRHNPS